MTEASEGTTLAEFSLHPQLAADTLPVAELPLSSARLMRDANYAWLLLVPRRSATEIVDLEAAEREQLMGEIVLASKVLRQTVPCDKLNVAALGNVVPQLHVHVIARRIGDAAWPKPVWGAVPAKAYAAGEAEALAETIAVRLRQAA
jgi:diadenosine tetraphosphate (Ap4A) HIT family hydrolase